MQKEELSFPENKYEFEYLGGANNSYLFKTAIGIKYEVQCELIWTREFPLQLFLLS
jgi:hypothetical protein